MLQSVEYEVAPYFAWLWRTHDFRSVMNRRELDRTAVARLFTAFLRAGILIQSLVAIALLAVAIHATSFALGGVAILLFIAAPFVWAHAVLFPLLVARRAVILPRAQRYRRETKRLLANHPGIKIAVAGSYGKTTMKELLRTVLAEGKKVAATPANKNVAAAHYSFVKNLKGDEDIIIVEFGEGKPGDVEAFTDTVQPDIGFITGLAPAHLDQYGSFEAAATDIFSLAAWLRRKDRPVYVNGDSPSITSHIGKDDISYTKAGVGKWQTSHIEVSIEGIDFQLSHGSKVVKLHSGLLGEHLVGVLSAAAAFALDLGLTPEQVRAGVNKTVPYEHRMQPYRLAGGWVIDDAYNGNIEGIKAGTSLLASLAANRKIYVTPGLVDQGEETEAVHIEAGKLIANAHPDVVVLMHNSVTDYIRQGLEQGNFAGELRIEDHPLQFYTGLDQILAAGDICLMQNDWTDNYA